MKKYFLLVMLFLISSTTWNASDGSSNKSLRALKIQVLHTPMTLMRL
jgi:hypothetical protein